MSAAKRKLYLVEGGPTPAERVAASLGELYDVEVVPVERAAEAIEASPEQALLAEGLTDEGRETLLGAHARQILQSIGEGVCLVQAGAGVTWASARFASLPEPIRERVEQVCRDALARLESDDGRASEHGVRATISEDSAGAGRFFEVFVSPVVGRGRRVTHVSAVVWDVTESMRTEIKLDAIDRAGAELVRLDVDAVRGLNAAERIKLLGDKIVRAAHERLQFDHFTVHLLNHETGRLELVMSEGLPDTVQEVDLYARTEGGGIVGYVAATGQSYLCPRTDLDDKYIQGLAKARSSLTVPLLMHDRVIGVFNVESDRPDAFTQADLQFAEMFARYVALAFHILDLLVVERYTTGETVSHTMEGEIREPLEDLSHEANWLRELASRDPEAAEHAERIMSDIESIRRRVSDVRRGPRSILGVEQALKEPKIDPRLKGRRFLVVDDEDAIRGAIADILRRRGAEVDVFKTGEDAIAALRAALAPGGPGYDMVISDIKLPDRNGYEVFTAARSLRPDIHVILMTGFGYDPSHSIVRASQEGLQCVLFKPFRAQRLLDEVRKPFERTSNDPAG